MTRKKPNSQIRTGLRVAACLLFAFSLSCREDVKQAPIDCHPPKGPGDPEIQNVIIISIDTLRADYLACYGHDYVKTPSIDQLADEGILFEQHINSAPTTLNSHTSLMTGTYGHTHGTPRNRYKVHKRNAMLAEVLKNAGYTTAAFIGAFPLHSRFNFDQGFDHFDENFHKLGMEVDQPQRRGDDVTDSVIAWLDAEKPRRMFLFVHYFDVHYPYAPPPPYDRMYRRDNIAFAGSQMDLRIMRDALAIDRNSMQPQQAILEALYCGEVSYTDEQIGRLFDALRERRLYESSLIVLTADHGEAMAEHWEFWNHGNSTYETAVNTPLIIRQPGQKLAGRRHKQVVSNIDVMPTILDRLGLGIPKKAEGVSFANVLDGKDVPNRGAVFAEATKPEGTEFESDPVWRNARKCRTVRTNRWKLIYRPVGDLTELFDLQSDPDERHNLLDDPGEETRARAAELTAMLQEWTRSATPFPEEIEPSMDTLKKLKSLGYAGGDSPKAGSKDEEQPPQ